MATDKQISTSQKPEVENPKKSLTLTLTPTNLSPSPHNLTDESNNPSTKAESERELDAVSPGEGSDKDDVDDKGTQVTAAVVSPTASSGPVNDFQKKQRRAERFGLPVHFSEEEKRNTRAERFGTGTGTGSEACKTSEELKRKARAERFGMSVPAGEEAKKKARLAKFAPDVKVDPLEEEKRKARALRFSQPPSKTVQHINGEGDVGLKTAIASNAPGGA